MYGRKIESRETEKGKRITDIDPPELTERGAAPKCQDNELRGGEFCGEAVTTIRAGLFCYGNGRKIIQSRLGERKHVSVALCSMSIIFEQMHSCALRGFAIVGASLCPKRRFRPRPIPDSTLSSSVTNLL